MMRFILQPNLPSHDVKVAVCGTDDMQITDLFQSIGIILLKNEKNPYIDSSVSSHSDMALLHLGNDKIIIDKNQNLLRNTLTEHGFTVYSTKNEIMGSYPDDVKLNIIIAGNNAIGNFKHCDADVLKLLKDKRLISVNQGYSKCSALVINEKSIITDDISIHRKITDFGFDSLLISKGDISLKNHEYGFIGGASGKIAKDKVVFFGDVTKHRDFDKINEFLLSHNCSYICTDNGKLRDIGGIIPLFEDVY